MERIKKAAHKLGNSIQTAKPYYEARLYASQLAKETQAAQNNYDKARSIHAAAKEMVFLAEQGLGEKSSLDMACQEMLNHAASRVNQSQAECSDSRNALKICELKQEVATNRVAKLQSQLKTAIRSSRCERLLRGCSIFKSCSHILFLHSPPARSVCDSGETC